MGWQLDLQIIISLHGLTKLTPCFEKKKKKKLCKFGSYDFIGNFILFFIDIIYTENVHRLPISQVVTIGRQFGLTPMTY